MIRFQNECENATETFQARSGRSNSMRLAGQQAGALLGLKDEGDDVNEEDGRFMLILTA